MTNTSTAREGLEAFMAVIACYEHRVGHACRAVANHVPALLTDLPQSPIILDNACGTGAVTDELLRALPSAKFYAADVVPPMVQVMKANVAASVTMQNSVVAVDIMDGQALQYQSNFFDVSVTNFGIFFFPDPILGAKEIYRTLKPGGFGVVTVWKDLGFKPLLWEVQKRVKPINPMAELLVMEAWSDGKLLEKTLKKGGFTTVELKEVTEGMWGVSTDDLKSVLLENFTALVSRNWSDEEKAKLPEVTAEVLKDMESEYCVQSGGRVGVLMTAWIAVCKK
ncbi:MAG: hypothetical protein HETSPECPRED_002633 [Heterodermia speciosa]|uniref:Methyltransferase domain-containing protein n=1 Tax=Heterodermia speciosa TaxID=116794 RepID=A0A8H3J563_9LECA|nr:MAG: hypothetical protein HETSPECPRED_002633 [Heterodermia speciosa]